MSKEVEVVIVEDDFYARNAMELLLRRDWRTKVHTEVSTPAGLSKALKGLSQQQARDRKKGKEKNYLFLIDADIPHDHQWLSKTMQSIKTHSPQIRVLFTSMTPTGQVARMLGESNFIGYVLKDEIRYSLAWAVSFTLDHPLVITPGVCRYLEQNTPLPSGTVVLDGRNRFAGLSAKDTERARMAFIFSMERHEFADEGEISDAYAYGVVSELFNRIGLNDVLNGEADPKDYFGDHPLVLVHVEQAIAAIKEAEEKAAAAPRRMKKSKKEQDPDPNKKFKIPKKETLAFHLLTLPEIEIIS